MFRTTLLRAAGTALVAAWVAGCATDRLDAAPPGGVNLSGDWVLNVNLSDDPDKMGPDPDTTAPKPSGGHRGHGGGRGGPGGGGGMGMPPMGGEPPTSDNYQGYGFVKVGLDQSGSTAPAGGKPSRGASINRFPRAPATLSITQDKGSLTIKTNMPDGTQTADVYTAG